MKHIKLIIPTILIITLITTLVYINTRGELSTIEVVQETEESSSTSTMAFYIENDSGEYESASNVPTSGYTLNTSSSYCKVGDNTLSGVSMSYSNGYVSVSLSNSGAKCYLYFDISNALSTYLIATASSNGGSDTTLIQHTSDCDNGCAEDGKYRYSGGGTSSTTEVNNYICFGTSDLDTCLADTSTYLFRIIEVDPDDGYVKIIKSSSYGVYYWNGTDGTSSTVVTYNGYYNYWAVGSKLYATLATTLNTTYLNTFDSNWQNLIATYDWNIAGSGTYEESLKTRYDTETSETASFKIGLMNTYDYGYAAESSYWSTSGGVYYYDTAAAYKYDWLYLGSTEWTVARDSNDTGTAFLVEDSGCVSSDDVYYIRHYLDRPSFYLESTASYVSGSGTSTDPIIIK